MESSHVKIIEFIDDFKTNQNGKFFSARFAIWEIAKMTSISPKTIARVLTTLRQIKLIGRMPRAYKHKYWEVTKHWISAKDSIAKYEFYYVIRDEIGI